MCVCVCVCVDYVCMCISVCVCVCARACVCVQTYTHTHTHTHTRTHTHTHTHTLIIYTCINIIVSTGLCKKIRPTIKYAFVKRAHMKILNSQYEHACLHTQDYKIRKYRSIVWPMGGATGRPLFPSSAD